MKDRSIEVLAAMFLFIFLACAVALDDARYPRTIVDTAGRTVSVPMPVERIIVLNSDAAEAVVTLGAGDRVVGITEDILERGSHLPSLLSKQVIGTRQMGGEIDYELIGELAARGDGKPSDLVVIGFSGAGQDYSALEVEKKVAPFGIVNVGLDFYQPENLSEEMTKLGTILGLEKEASNYLKWQDEKGAGIEKAVDGLSLPRIYLERGPKKGLGDLVTYGDGSALNCFAGMARGRNIAGSLEKSAHVTWEWVLSEDPEVIIRTMSSEGSLGWEEGPSADTLELEKVFDEILGRPGTEGTSAVKNGRVFILYSDMLYGMDSVVGLAYLAKILHPEANLDPESIYKEYLDRLGLELPANRIFVYPEE